MQILGIFKKGLFSFLGVYVTRNSDTYKHGTFELCYNKAYENGINGLVVHKTNNAIVIGNVIWNNGKVSKSKPESRQPFAGLTLNHAKNVEVKNNFVKTETKKDYSYAVLGSILKKDSNCNKVIILSCFINTK